MPSKEDCYLAVFMTENSSQEIGCHNKGIGDGQRLAASRHIFRLFNTVFWFSIGDILRVIFVRILLRWEMTFLTHSPCRVSLLDSLVFHELISRHTPTMIVSI